MEQLIAEANAQGFSVEMADDFLIVTTQDGYNRPVAYFQVIGNLLFEISELTYLDAVG